MKLRFTWWQARAPREKALLGLAAFALLGAALFSALAPRLEERRRLVAELPQLRADLGWMEARVAVVRRLRAAAGEAASAGLGAGPGVSAAGVEEVLRALGLREQVSGLRPSGEQGGLAVVFNEVAFSDLALFVSRLQAAGQGRVVSAQVNRLEGQSGAVSASLTLR